MSASDLFRVISIVFAAVTFVVLGDTAGKLLTADGVDPFIIAWTRFALAAVFFLPFSGLKLGELSCLKDWRVLLRAAFIAGGICSILTALKTEPIANVFGAFFIGPVVSYLLAILFLGEKPSQTRGFLLGFGFIGVMLVVKPGFGVTPGIVFALVAGVCYGAYLVTTKMTAGDYRPRLLLFSQLLVGSILLTPAALSAELPQLDVTVSLLIAGSAFGSTLGNYLLVIAHRKAEASLIAPLVYTQLISATLLGILVFGDWPDIYSLLGLTIIVLSGLGSLLATRRDASRATAVVERS
ncbi:DMT family transporter [Pelagibius sp. Alg239-R121]|uniref:DMT family transporter n=1 Tax=Pelagibius sp. Alg239-R121 TaxID=2993448 RepID=UPI0024A751BE|nr:DMT family transporter [Pelagibius sp. Alg239-R121]